MKKVMKTDEEITRDQLALSTRTDKGNLEADVLRVRRLAKAMTLIPEDTIEFRTLRADHDLAKWDVLTSFRQYEESRAKLSDYCQEHHLAGNTFIPGFELLQMLADK